MADSSWSGREARSVQVSAERRVNGRAEILPTHPARHTRGLRNVRKSGAYRDRTGDLRLAKPALSQLS
jgi:hypothetical protein